MLDDGACDFEGLDFVGDGFMSGGFDGDGLVNMGLGGGGFLALIFVGGFVDLAECGDGFVVVARTKISGHAEPKPGHNRALFLILSHNSPLQERCNFFARVLQKH